MEFISGTRVVLMSFRAISYSVFQDRVASLELIIWPRLASVPLRC